MQSTLVILVRFQWHLNFLDKVSKNAQISNLVKIPTVGAGLFHAEGQTDMTNLIVTFRNYADAPKNDFFLYCGTAMLIAVSELRYSDVDCSFGTAVQRCWLQFVPLLNKHRLQSSPLSRLVDPFPEWRHTLCTLCTLDSSGSISGKRSKGVPEPT
jgi:hypothetical protein